MKPIPFLLRAFGGWQRIKDQIDQVADRGDDPLVPYSLAPDLYRFDGWGLKGFPPRLACNVKYFPPDTNETIDLGRFPR
jgi:hypothetical protein